MKIIHKDTGEVSYESDIRSQVEEYYQNLLFFYKCMKMSRCPFILSDK